MAVTVKVGVGLSSAVGEGVSVGSGLGESGVTVGVGVRVGVRLGVGEAVALGLGLGVALGEGVAVALGSGAAVAVGMAGARRAQTQPLPKPAANSSKATGSRTTARRIMAAILAESARQRKGRARRAQVALWPFRAPFVHEAPPAAPLCAPLPSA